MPPAREFDEAEIMKGHQLYHAYCFQCHGVAAVSSGVVSDLRFLSSSIHRNFDKIVHDGALSEKGMPSFDPVLDAEAIDAIQSYVTLRAMQDREAMLAAMEAQAEEQP
jgi:quinohemoprotein ethanol dehydrogenase